eukprot:PhM_4_TR2305/c0_g1_i1/m.100758
MFCTNNSRLFILLCCFTMFLVAGLASPTAVLANEAEEIATIDVDADADGFTASMGDCDDSNTLVHPTAAEVCGDGIDNNCDGVVDDEASCLRGLTTSNVWLSGTIFHRQGEAVRAVELQRSSRTLIFTLCCGYKFMPSLVLGDGTMFQSFLDTLIPTHSPLYPHRGLWISQAKTRLVANGTTLVILTNPIPELHITERDDTLRLHISSAALDCKCPQDLAVHPEIVIARDVIPPLNLVLRDVPVSANLCIGATYTLDLLPAAELEALPSECFYRGAFSSVELPTSSLEVTFPERYVDSLWVAVDCGDAVRNATLPVRATVSVSPAKVHTPRLVVAGKSARVAAVATTKGTHGEWSVEGDSTVTIESPELAATRVHNLEKDNTLTWTVHHAQHECPSTAAVVEITSYVPHVQVASAQTVCQEVYTLTADALPHPSLHGQWVARTAHSEVTPRKEEPNVADVRLALGINTIDWVVTGDADSKHVTTITLERVSSEGATARNISVPSTQTTLTLRGTVPPRGSGRWLGSVSSLSIDNDTDPTSLVVLPAWSSGTYDPVEHKLLWVVEVPPCDATTTHVTITVMPPEFTAPDAGDDVCTDMPCVDLNAQEGHRDDVGTWSVVAAPSGSDASPTPELMFKNKHSAKTSVCDIPFGLTTLQWAVVSRGTTYTDTLSIYRRTLPGPKATIATPPGRRVLVMGSTVRLRAEPATAPFTGTWHPFQLRTEEIDATDLVPGEMNVSWVVSDPKAPVWCKHEDRAVVLLDIKLADAGTNQYVCSGDARLHGTLPKAARGQWATLSEAKIEDSASPTTSLSDVPPGSNVFRWTVKSQESNTTHVAEVLVVRLGSLQKYRILSVPDRVVGNRLTLRATAFEHGFSGSWSSHPKTTIKSQQNYEAVAMDLPSGEVTFRWTVAHVRNLCPKHTDSVTVTVARAVAPGEVSMCDAATDELEVLAEPAPSGLLGAWSKVDCPYGEIVASTSRPHWVALHWAAPHPSVCVLRWTIWDRNDDTQTDSVDVRVMSCPTHTKTVILPPSRVVLRDSVDVAYRTIPADVAREDIQWEVSIAGVKMTVKHDVVVLSNLPVGVAVQLSAKIAGRTTRTTVTRQVAVVSILGPASSISVCDIRRGITVRLCLSDSSTARWVDVATLNTVMRTLPNAWWHSTGALHSVYVESGDCAVLEFRAAAFYLRKWVYLIPGNALPGRLFLGVHQEESVEVPSIMVTPFALRRDNQHVFDEDIARGGVGLSLDLLEGEWGNVQELGDDVIRTLFEEATVPTVSNWNTLRSQIVSLADTHARSPTMLFSRLLAAPDFCTESTVTLSSRVAYGTLCKTTSNDLLDAVEVVSIQSTPTRLRVAAHSTAQYQCSLERGNATIDVELVGNALTESCARMLSPEHVVLSPGLEPYRRCMFLGGLSIHRVDGRRLVIHTKPCPSITFQDTEWLSVRLPNECLRCPNKAADDVSSLDRASVTTQRFPVYATKAHISVLRENNARAIDVCDDTVRRSGMVLEATLEGDVWSSGVGDGKPNDQNRALLGSIQVDSFKEGNTMEAYLYQHLLQVSHLERLDDTTIRLHFPQWSSYSLPAGVCHEELRVVIPSITSHCAMCVAAPNAIKIYAQHCIVQSEVQPGVARVRHPCSNVSIDVANPDNAESVNITFRGETVQVHFPSAEGIRRELALRRVAHHASIGCLGAMVLCFLAVPKVPPVAVTIVAALAYAMPGVALHGWFVPWFLHLVTRPSYLLVAGAVAHAAVYTAALAI